MSEETELMLQPSVPSQAVTPKRSEEMELHAPQCQLVLIQEKAAVKIDDRRSSKERQKRICTPHLFDAVSEH